jgi:CYTH domain-containing protein
MNRAMREIYRVLGEPEPMVAKRKFLIEMPDLEQLKKKYNAVMLDMMQSYLVVTQPGVERRIRQQKNGEDYLYFYTEKHTREDGAKWVTEKPISEKQYVKYLMESDSALHHVRKNKYRFIADTCRYEVDVYPFSEDKAILFQYAPSNDTVIPEEMKVIREVTGEEEYKNRMLALVQKL